MDLVDKPVSILLTGFFVWLDPSCRYEVDACGRDSVSSNELARIKYLECEVKELRKAKEILKLASAFFPRRSRAADSSLEGFC